MARYGFRSGVTQLLRFVRLLCRLYVVFSATINAWVEANLEGADKTTVLEWLAAITAVCGILEAVPDD